jgi:hypothetical protein
MNERDGVDGLDRWFCHGTVVTGNNFVGDVAIIQHCVSEIQVMLLQAVQKRLSWCGVVYRVGRE